MVSDDTPIILCSDWNMFATSNEVGLGLSSEFYGGNDWRNNLSVFLLPAGAKYWSVELCIDY